MRSGRGSNQGDMVDGGREQRQGTVERGGDHSCLGLDGEDRDLDSNERHHVTGVLATALLVGAAVVLVVARSRGAVSMVGGGGRGAGAVTVRPGLVALRRGPWKLAGVGTGEQTSSEDQEEQEGDEMVSHSEVGQRRAAHRPTECNTALSTQKFLEGNRFPGGCQTLPAGLDQDPSR